MARNLTRRQTLAGLALVGATGGRAFAQADQEPEFLARPREDVFQ